MSDDKETFTDQLSRVRLMATGDPTWDLSDNDLAAIRSVVASHEHLFEIARTVVAVCDSGNENTAQLACMEGSPLVGECRKALARVQER